MSAGPHDLPPLCEATLGQLRDGVQRPDYDRGTRGIGVVHFGPGAFHRAHQALYFDDLLARGGDWGICAVSLHSRGVRDALAHQDGLYSVALLDRTPQHRVVGAIREVLWAVEDRERILRRLAEPATQLVTLTVTEKGYCLRGEDLDVDHPDIRHDRAQPTMPRSVIGYLVAGLQMRRDKGLPPFTAISCDNLADNGRKLARAVIQLAERLDPALARWIAARGAFPSTMVDSITPATDDALRTSVSAAIGLHDAWPVQRETFTQWVVEDRFAATRPDLAAVGVTLTHDVAAFERAKLRLLNGPHSTLAYVGSLLGHDTVSQAMQDGQLAGFIERLMHEAIIPTLSAPDGLDLPRYCDDILARFRNPAVRHLLSQIAWDGSQKLPFRILGSVQDRLALGGDIAALCVPLAAWMHFVRTRAQRDEAITDALAPALHDLGRACRLDARADVAGFLALPGVFPDALRNDSRFTDALTAAYAAMSDATPAAVRAAL